MAKNEKAVLIKRLLLILNELTFFDCSVLDLSIATGASERTIQRDMKTLESAGLVEKHHGKWHLIADTWVSKLEKLAHDGFVAAYLRESPQLGAKHIYADDVFKVIVEKPIDLSPHCHKLILVLRQHILQHNRIIVAYSRQAEQTFILEPYKIIYFDGFWYIAGVVDSALVKLRLDFIDNIAPVKAEDCKDFKITFTPEAGHLQDIDNAATLGVGSDKTTVQIQAHGKLEDVFNKRQVFSDQAIEAGGKVRFTVTNFEDFFYMMARYMPLFEIISPADFKLKLKEKIKAYF